MNVSRIIRELEKLEDLAKREAERGPISESFLLPRLAAIIEAARHGEADALRMAQRIAPCIADARQRMTGADLV